MFRKKIYMSGLLIFCVGSCEIAVYPQMCQSQAPAGLLFRRHTFLHIKSYNILGTNTWKVNECLFNCSRISFFLSPKKKKIKSSQNFSPFSCHSCERITELFGTETDLFHSFRDIFLLKTDFEVNAFAGKQEIYMSSCSWVEHFDCSQWIVIIPVKKSKSRPSYYCF